MAAISDDASFKPNFFCRDLLIERLFIPNGADSTSMCRQTPDATSMLRLRIHCTSNHLSGNEKIRSYSLPHHALLASRNSNPAALQTVLCSVKASLRRFRAKAHAVKRSFVVRTPRMAFEDALCQGWRISVADKTSGVV